MLNRYFSIYLGAHLLPAAIGFFAITAYTRLLSPAEYGVYVVGMSIAGILGAVFFAWIRLSVSRYQATSAAVDFRGTAMVAFSLTVLALCSLAPFAMLFYRGVSVNLLAASIFVAIAVNAVEIGQDFERANLRPYRFAAVAIVRSLSGLAFGLVAVEMGWGGLGLIAAFGLGSLIGAVLNFVGTSTRMARWQRTQLIQFARYGLPLSIGGLLGALYSSSDRLIVAYLLGEEAAGLFGVAADLPRQFLVMLASAVAAATFPIVFRSLTENGESATRERLNESVELLLAVVLPVVVWLALAADQVAGTLVGTGFRASVSYLLPVLAVARLFGVANQFLLPDQLSAFRAAFPLGRPGMFHVAPQHSADVPVGGALRIAGCRACDVRDRSDRTAGRHLPDPPCLPASFRPQPAWWCGGFCRRHGNSHLHDAARSQRHRVLRARRREFGWRCRLCRRGMAVQCRPHQDPVDEISSPGRFSQHAFG
jgi:hypothetical protein